MNTDIMGRKIKAVSEFSEMAQTHYDRINEQVSDGEYLLTHQDEITEVVNIRDSI